MLGLLTKLDWMPELVADKLIMLIRNGDIMVAFRDIKWDSKGVDEWDGYMYIKFNKNVDLDLCISTEADEYKRSGNVVRCFWDL
jgi:hypothetical protein